MPTAEQAATEKVLRAVAEMQMPTEGACDDAYCPFDGCRWDGLTVTEHGADCPVTLATALLGGEPLPLPADDLRRGFPMPPSTAAIRIVGP